MQSFPNTQHFNANILFKIYHNLKTKHQTFQDDDEVKLSVETTLIGEEHKEKGAALFSKSGLTFMVGGDIRFTLSPEEMKLIIVLEGQKINIPFGNNNLLTTIPNSPCFFKFSCKTTNELTCLKDELTFWRTL